MINYVYAEEYLVALAYPPEKALKQTKVNVKRAPSPLWLNQIKTVKEEDNPILAIIKIK